MLIVSSTEKSIAFLQEVLAENNFDEIVTVHSCGEARQLLLSRDFDLCIINAPLPDEFGTEFAKDITSRSETQAILIVKAEIYEEVSAKMEDWGVYTISKPVSRSAFWSAIKLVNAAYNRLSRLQTEKGELLKKIEDVRVIDRAKCLLIEYLKMSEKQAHKYIEKQAMDLRVTKRVVANSVLKTYENWDSLK